MPAFTEVFASFGFEFDRTKLDEGEQSVQNAIGSFRNLATVMAGGAMVRAISGFLTGMAAVGDELDKTSRQIGLSADELQSWRHVADLSGVSGSTFSTALTRLQRNMLEARRGSAAAVESFSRLGIAFANQDGSLRDVSDVLLDVAANYDGLGDAATQSATLSTLLGRAGSQLGPLFAQGADGIAQMRAEFEELGGGISQEVVEQSAEITDEMARLDQQILAVKSALANVLFPAMRVIISAARGVVGAFQRLTEGTNAMRIVAVALGVVFGALAASAGRAAITIASAFAPVILPVLAVAAAVAGVLLVVDELWQFMRGGDSVIGRLIDRFNELGTGAKIAAGILGAGFAVAFAPLIALALLLRDVYRLFTGGESVIGDAARAASAAFQSAWEAVTTWFFETWAALLAVVEGIVQPIESVVSRIARFFRLLFDDIVALFSGGESAVGAFIDAVFGIGTVQSVLAILRTAINLVTAAFDATVAFLTDVFAVTVATVMDGAALAVGFVLDRIDDVKRGFEAVRDFLVGGFTAAFEGVVELGRRIAANPVVQAVVQRVTSTAEAVGDAAVGAANTAVGVATSAEAALVGASQRRMATAPTLPRGGPGAGTLVNAPTTITVSGAGDPRAVGREVARQVDQRNVRAARAAEGQS